MSTKTGNLNWLPKIFCIVSYMQNRMKIVMLKIYELMECTSKKFNLPSRTLIELSLLKNPLRESFWITARQDYLFTHSSICKPNKK